MGQIIFVTGASSGFGRMIATDLAAAGHTAYASMRGTEGKNAKTVAETAVEAKEKSIDLRTIELDVQNEASIEAAVNDIVTEHGRIVGANERDCRADDRRNCLLLLLKGVVVLATTAPAPERLVLFVCGSPATGECRQRTAYRTCSTRAAPFHGTRRPALEQQVFHVLKAQREADVHLHHQPDHLGRRVEAVKRGRGLGSEFAGHVPNAIRLFAPRPRWFDGALPENRHWFRCYCGFGRTANHLGSYSFASAERSLTLIEAAP